MAKKPSIPNPSKKGPGGRRPLSPEVLAARAKWKNVLAKIVTDHADAIDFVDLAADITARLRSAVPNADAISPSLVWQWARTDDSEFGKSAAGTRTPGTRRVAQVLLRALTAALLVKPTVRDAGFVISAAFSPDGARIVTASDDGTARVWDAATGGWLHTLSGHEGLVHSAAFSPDGGRIVTASWDQTARVWDAATGGWLHTLSGHERWVHSAAFSPDGARIVTASDDGTARVWDAATGGLLHTLSGHKNVVRSAAFSPDGARIVTASGDKTARVWDAATGGLLHTLSGHEDQVYSAAFSPDGGRIVTASRDQTARVWAAATGGLLHTLSGHEDQVYSAAFSPDGGRIVTASRDQTARVWDMDLVSGAQGRLVDALLAATDALFPPDLQDDENDDDSATADANREARDEAEFIRRAPLRGRPGDRFTESRADARAPWTVAAQAKLSDAAHETLAIIAHRQPTTRAAIEAIRGVACGEVLHTLLDRRLITIAGRSEELGRPLLYATTKEFLNAFDVPNLKKDFPGLADLGPTAAPVPTATPPTRRPLPEVRRSITHKFTVADTAGYLTAGLYDDGQPGELFITLAKADSTLAGMLDGVCVAAGVALQHGVPLTALVNKFSHMRFDPAGATDNPDIPFAKSILDYVFRWLGMQFIPGYREANTPRRENDAPTARPRHDGSP